jgi:hypothetical protein
MRDILTSFLKIGLTAYGGPAIVGVMQAEFQERRQWLTKAQFVEGLASTAADGRERCGPRYRATSPPHCVRNMRTLQRR